jgi:hypothetical protein
MTPELNSREKLRSLGYNYEGRFEPRDIIIFDTCTRNDNKKIIFDLEPETIASMPGCFGLEDKAG